MIGGLISSSVSRRFLGGIQRWSGSCPQSLPKSHSRTFLTNKYRQSTALTRSQPTWFGMPSYQLTSCLDNMMQTRNMATKKHKAVIRQSKGFRGRSKNCFKIAIRRLEKSWQYAYVGRKLKRRRWKQLWIVRIQAGVRQYFFSYSQFMYLLSKKTSVQLNRRMLSELAATEPFSFKAVVDVVQHESGVYKTATDYDFLENEQLFSEESNTSMEGYDTDDDYNDPDLWEQYEYDSDEDELVQDGVRRRSAA